MKKNLLYLFLLLLVGAGVYFYIFKDKDRTFSEEEINFTIKDTSSVGRIFMTRNNGQFIDLTRTKNGWITNNLYPSRISTVNYLLRVLYKQVARYPVAEKQHNHIVKSMSGNSVKVEVYDLKGNVMTKFYVGPDDEKAFGTFLFHEGAKRIFFVQIPNFEGGLSAIYSTNIEDWRSRNVFQIPSENIENVSVNYPSEPKKSFTIQQGKTLSFVADNLVTKNRTLNEKRANSYLSFFNEVNCEGYLTGIAGMDSILSKSPLLCNINLKEKNGKTHEVAIYRMALNKRSKNIVHTIVGAYDNDHLYAVFNNHKDTAIIQYLCFEKIFRSAEEFFVSDSVQSPLYK